ncbi:MAG: PAS domain S-box protein [Aeromicrobium sp.]|nr:PAS domain S-box protein [Burkholderiales bacterium]
MNEIRVPMAFAGIALALMVGGGISAFVAVRDVNRLEVKVQKITVVIDQAEMCLSALRDAQTGTRGYIITGDVKFLAPYEAVNRDMSLICNISTSAASLSESVVTLRALDGLAALVKQKMAELATQIEMRRIGDMAGVTARVATAAGKKMMDQIRLQIGSYIVAQQVALEAAHAESKSIMQDFIFLMVALSVLGVGLGTLFVWLVYRDAAHRVAGQQHAETSRALNLQQNENEDLSAAVNALQLREELLEVTLNSIGDAVIATDAHGIVSRINVTAQQLTGWSAADAIGQQIEEVFRIVSKLTRLPVAVPVGETLRHGSKIGLVNHTVLIGRDGCEHDVGDSCAPIRDRDNKVIGAVLVFRDVTAEYQLKQILADTLAKVQAILSTAADGIVTFKALDGKIESVNASAIAMFGYSVAEIIGKPFITLIPELEDDLNSGALHHYAATAAGHASGLGREVTGRRHDGTFLPLEIATSEVVTSSDRLFTVMMRDNTVRKQVEAERTAFDLALQATNIELAAVTRSAESANLAKSEFLSSMSHELRTPLGAILGFAQLLELDTPPPTPTQRRSIDQILKAGWYLLDLINEILDLAQIESGRISLSIEPTSLAKLLNECQSMIEPQAQAKNIKLVFPTLPPNLLAKADWTRLKQVLINLLSNAIKYNRPHGTVVVRVVAGDFGAANESQGRATGAPLPVRMSVTDSGLGLSPEKLKQLFQPFNRLGQESSLEAGTGIGLVVCKRLVEQMGGTMGVISNVDIGSTFWIEVPRADAPASVTAVTAVGLASVSVAANRESILSQPLESAPSLAPDIAQTDANLLPNQYRYCLLYVEDNPANRMLVEDLLARRQDIRLITAEDGDSGIEMARAEHPDVILMDINLPGTSGVQAMKILALDAVTRHIRVVALSANAMPRDIECGLQAGFFRYLTKPIKVNELLSAIDEALEIPTPTN